MIGNKTPEVTDARCARSICLQPNGTRCVPCQAGGPLALLSARSCSAMLITMLIRAFSILTLFSSAALSAEIYRWVDPQGGVHFSDRWPPTSEALRIEGTVTRSETAGAAEEPQSPDGPRLGPYSAFEILSPAANETLTQATDNLSVSLLLDPPLVEGHRLQMDLDDVAVPLDKAATQFRLTGIAFGSHRLRAEILDADGLLLARTATQVFHLRPEPEQPGVLR